LGLIPYYMVSDSLAFDLTQLHELLTEVRRIEVSL
jgi:hypothetical protein